MADSKKPKHKLRSGFTTGACAAAAAKGALLLLFGVTADSVTIPFPGGERHGFALHGHGVHDGQARVAVIKDGGDDPDVTNGAEIIALVKEQQKCGEERALLSFRGGPGVGRVTKPGLPVPVGEPAINPVPRQMIKEAVREAFADRGYRPFPLVVTISVTDGDQLARKTPNHRLGIVGGLSILGTTGIVRPVSAKAWTDTIEASMRVARAAGLERVLLATGRTSEAAAQQLLGLPEEGLVMMGDYLEYALQAAARHGFTRIYLAGMWAKVLKCALRIPQTHVRNGALEVGQAVDLLGRLGLPSGLAAELSTANTAREILVRLRQQGYGELILAVCRAARRYGREVSGLAVEVLLVTSEEGVIAHVRD